MATLEPTYDQPWHDKHRKSLATKMTMKLSSSHMYHALARRSRECVGILASVWCLSLIPPSAFFSKKDHLPIENKTMQLVFKEALSIHATTEGNQSSRYELPDYWIATYNKLRGRAIALAAHTHKHVRRTIKHAHELASCTAQPFRKKESPTSLAYCRLEDYSI